MNVLDWIVVLVLLVSVLLGAWRGLVFEVLSLLNWVLAFVLAQWLGPWVAQHLPWSGGADSVRKVIGFVLVFLVSAFCGGLLARGASALLGKAGLGPVDRTLGGVFGLLRGLLLVLVISALVLLTGWRHESWWKESRAARGAEWTLARAHPLLPPAVGRYLP